MTFADLWRNGTGYDTFLGHIFSLKMVTYVPNKQRKVTIIVDISVLRFKGHRLRPARSSVYSFIYVHVYDLCAAKKLCIRCQFATFFTIRTQNNIFYFGMRGLCAMYV